MVLPVFQATVADAAGNILPGATVTVRRESDNGLASLFSDRAGTSALGNPIITDSNGFIRFYTAEDTYRVDAVSGLTSVTWRHVALSLRIDLTGPLDNKWDLHAGLEWKTFSTHERVVRCVLQCQSAVVRCEDHHCILLKIQFLDGSE